MSGAERGTFSLTLLHARDADILGDTGPAAADHSGLV